ncbi:MAG: TIGR04282 family arsenosugar biosynthesis glycosyltransferase [Desulfuromonadaceae bacterium]|nr:TIGR04282 family arsenosugar biosynthesis glycosyltransferase [Desulfuromonadaceae bacterium]MDD5105115.1 TIGR04282 family arsenosugar biosynthesis glycosyltransferase [Desulfuromonadaceae bacterium]
MSCDAVVALFVRCPLPGRVKTRLAAHIGNESACALYCAIVSDILGNFAECGLPLYLFHDGTDIGEVPLAWRDASAVVVPQLGETIGERMAAAFNCCFADGWERVILAGSDIPGLDAGILRAAVAALATLDAALAPAVDGGYGLIALRRDSYTQELFRDIPWSTDQVLRLTVKRCREYKLKVKMLEVVQDIDIITDLAAYCKNPFNKATATNDFLKKRGFI